jgi:hypothetical protein
VVSRIAEMTWDFHLSNGSGFHQLRLLLGRNSPSTLA